MTDEEFYKNELIGILNAVREAHECNGLPYCLLEAVQTLELKVEIEYGLELIKNIKRKLIIKEKTWYKLRNGKIRYVFAVVPLDFYFPCENGERVLCFGENGRSYRHLDGTMSAYGISDDFDLIRECTPEEVKEIEAKLTEKKNDNE